jgi:DNA/RNA endonuclease G (NUC1)
MNPARRLAHYSAYNVDGQRLVRIPRRRDKWAPDPLLPDSLQMELALLRHSPYDRGHLMARATVSWGEHRQASISARQAFYWPNVAPQHAQLNRGWWLKLEKWERDVAQEYGKLTGFTGPVFSEKDESFRGELQLEDGLVAFDTFRVPRAYWKVVVVVKSGQGLAQAAYLMNQFEMLEAKGGRNFQLTDYRVSIKDLEQSTRLRFDDVFHRAAELTE